MPPDNPDLLITVEVQRYYIKIMLSKKETFKQNEQTFLSVMFKACGFITENNNNKQMRHDQSEDISTGFFQTTRLIFQNF